MKMNEKQVRRGVAEAKTVEELPLFLDVYDVAELLGIALGSAYQLFRTEEFPSVKVSSKRWKVGRDELFKWISSGGSAV